jgi:hypothetical protein
MESHALTPHQNKRRISPNDLWKANHIDMARAETYLISSDAWSYWKNASFKESL